MPDLNVLSFVERQVPTTWWERRWFFLSRQVEGEHMFLEFAVDGKPLRDWVREWQNMDDLPEGTTSLSDFHPELAIEQLDRLLGNKPHQFGDRAWLLFCHVCQDEGCGGVTADVVRVGGSVTWSNFGWDTSFPMESEGPVRFANGASFTFDEAAYDALLTRVRNHFKAVNFEDKLA